MLPVRLGFTAAISGPRSNRDPLDLVKRDLIACAIIEFPDYAATSASFSKR